MADCEKLWCGYWGEKHEHARSDATLVAEGSLVLLGSAGMSPIELDIADSDDVVTDQYTIVVEPVYFWAWAPYNVWDRVDRSNFESWVYAFCQPHTFKLQQVDAWQKLQRTDHVG